MIAWALPDSMSPEEQAALVGTVEGCWQAFATGLFRQLGSEAGPEAYKAMEEEARRAASAAYEEAYRRAIERP
jgi:hypothetical protein